MIKEEIRKIIDKYGTLGLMLVLLFGGLLIQIVLSIFFSIIGKELGYHSVIQYFLITGDTFIFRPWTLITYGFIYPLHLGGVIGFLIDCMFLWSFGGMFMQLWGNERLKRFLTLSVPLLGVIGVLFSLLFRNEPVFTMAPVVMSVVFAVAFLTPDYPVSVWGMVQLKMIYFAFIALIIEFITWGASGIGLTIIAGAAAGFFFTYQMKKGNDLSETIFLFIKELFKKRTRKPNFKVTINPDKTDNEKEISQEEVDFILDKISQSGYQSLTRQEKEKLERFSGKRKSDN